MGLNSFTTDLFSTLCQNKFCLRIDFGIKKLKGSLIYKAWVRLQMCYFSFILFRLFLTITVMSTDLNSRGRSTNPACVVFGAKELNPLLQQKMSEKKSQNLCTQHLVYRQINLISALSAREQLAHMS